MKEIKQATLSDAQFINSIIPPIKGEHVGGGIHVQIGDNWLERILLGEDVPGATYAKIQDDGALLVDEAIEAKLSDASLKTADKAKASVLAAKLEELLPAETTPIDQPTLPIETKKG